MCLLFILTLIIQSLNHQRPILLHLPLLLKVIIQLPNILLLAGTATPASTATAGRSPTLATEDGAALAPRAESRGLPAASDLVENFLGGEQEGIRVALGVVQGVGVGAATHGALGVCLIVNEVGSLVVGQLAHEDESEKAEE